MLERNFEQISNNTSVCNLHSCRFHYLNLPYTDTQYKVSVKMWLGYIFYAKIQRFIAEKFLFSSNANKKVQFPVRQPGKVFRVKLKGASIIFGDIVFENDWYTLNRS